jgi:DNA excision repair protein ERCC-2
MRVKRELRISVRDLVEYGCRSGDLNGEFSGMRRAVDAIRAHQRIQRSRPADYQAEVPVTYRVEAGEFDLHVGGRIDGVYTGSDHDPGTVIDEIKTVSRWPDDGELPDHPMHWGQARVYGFIYAAQHGIDELDIQLTYCHLDSDEIRESRRSLAFEELKRFFEELIEGYLDWARTVISWSRLRDETIRSLTFPFPAYRPGQRRMAVETYRAVQAGDQLLMQAATGIGKTMAVVFAAVKAIADGCTDKVFYLTARTTGKSAAEKALAVLQGRGLRLKSLTLTAKDKICFCPDSGCNAEECEFARGYYDRRNAALREIFVQDAITRRYLEAACMRHRLCPFALSLELAHYVDCIICDYNYAFDPRVFLRRFFQETQERYTFLVDEAHNLVDRAREMFSAEIRKKSFLQLRRKIKRDLPELYKNLGKVNSWMLKTRKKAPTEQTSWAVRQPPEGIFGLLRQVSATMERWLVQNIKTEFKESLLDLYFEINAFIRVMERYDDAYVTCYDRTEKDLRIKLFCIDPAGQIAEALNRCKAAVFFSATMTPAQYFKTVFGCRDSAVSLCLPSPFAVENLKVFVADRISTLYRRRESTAAAVAEVLQSLVGQKKGNYLLFFPSYRYMHMVHDIYRGRGENVGIIVQKPDMSEEDRHAFLDRFARENPETLVGFAVMGGIFGEAIDLVGDRLSGAAIVGVGLPAVCLEREMIRQYYTDRIDAGFEFAYLYPGFNRVLQAAGRVIRSENDRGAVVLIDQRFATHRYRRLLPREWNPIRISGDAQLRQQLQQFWNSAP